MNINFEVELAYLIFINYFILKKFAWTTMSEFF